MRVTQSIKPTNIYYISHDGDKGTPYIRTELTTIHKWYFSSVTSVALNQAE